MATIKEIPNTRFSLLNAKSWEAQECTQEEINNLKKGDEVWIDGLDDNWKVTIISVKDNMVTGTIEGLKGIFKFSTDYIQEID